MAVDVEAEAAYIDVRARRKTSSSLASSSSSRRRDARDAARESTLEAVVREQRALLRAERRRGDEAEEALRDVTAQADALSATLDDISIAFRERRARGREEEEGARRSRGGETTTEARGLVVLRDARSENERLKREVRERDAEIDRLRAEACPSRTAEAMVDESDARSASLGERRRLMRELAEARREIADAKLARARALAEALELRKKLETLETVSSDQSETTTVTIPAADAAVETGSGGAADWADIDWDAAYAEMDSVKEEKRNQRTHSVERKLGAIEEIDWDAAYAEIEDVRARKRELGERNASNSNVKN